MGWPTREEAAAVAARWRPGDRVRLVRMGEDPRPVPDGALGTVDHVDGAGSVHVLWDTGSTLALVPGEDEWERANEDQEG